MSSGIALSLFLSFTLAVAPSASVAQTAEEARDSAGRTALIRAAMEDRPEEVRRLLGLGADVAAVDAIGFTALLYAAQYSHESVRILIEAGADVNFRDELGTSALSIAIEAGRDETAALLRANGAKEKLEERLDAALRAGEREEVARLIEAGADVDALDTGAYQTPLMTAIEARDMESVLLLLSAGADPSREGTGIETTNESAVTFAARQGSTWVLRQLLEREGVPRASRGSLERGLFAGCGHRDVLAILIEKGAAPNARGPRGRTPLMCAAAANAEASVELLLEAGADPSLRSDDGESAAALAEAAGNASLAARLRR